MKRKIKAILYQLLRGIFDLLSVPFGNVLVFLLPKKARQLSKNGLTVVVNNNMSIPERFMRAAIFKKLEKRQDYNTIAKLHQSYWANKGTEWLSQSEDLFKTDFLPNCTFIFDLLKKELSNQSEEFNTLVEIGTGNGAVLNYLSSEFPKINHFVGLDLSPVQIEINNKKFSNNNRLEFVTSDGFEWVKEHGHDNTIFVTSGGVLEYFTELRLQDFLRQINALGKTIFVAIEPNSTKHNFETNPNSQVYGREWAFSHNYPKLFKDTGFSVWHFSQKHWAEGTNIQTFIGAKN
ncbi:class I SAM-dependent methyltransferase [Mariniphaga sp.]|uniref:class I SAM-dependent methyltransferase n=1 Tax=Mariniphaga sp. TaxID=1954475 RepID=UPI003567E374